MGSGTEPTDRVYRSHVFGPQGKSNGGGGHKGRWDPTDDGSEAQAVDGIADEGDPNYDPNADDHDNNYVLVRSVVVFTFCSSSDGAACVELVDIPSSTILVYF